MEKSTQKAVLIDMNTVFHEAVSPDEYNDARNWIQLAQQRGAVVALSYIDAPFFRTAMERVGDFNGTVDCFKEIAKIVRLEKATTGDNSLERINQDFIQADTPENLASRAKAIEIAVDFNIDHVFPRSHTGIEDHLHFVKNSLDISGSDTLCVMDNFLILYADTGYTLCRDVKRAHAAVAEFVP